MNTEPTRTYIDCPHCKGTRAGRDGGVPMTRLEQLQEEALRVGLHVRTYSPGDGVTRYRFFDAPGNSYFGPANGIYTALGFKEADMFLTAYSQGRGAS